VTQQRQRDLLILGKAIRSVREQHELSAGALAAAAGVPQARIAALESGRLDADFELLLALAEQIGVRPSAFFLRAEELSDNDDAPQPPSPNASASNS
jgi:transcriptional regulator with XRE-family HTH domain